jgi:hypothetical protein
MTDFGLNDVRPAVVAIGCHYGHLAPDLATLSAVR